MRIWAEPLARVFVLRRPMMTTHDPDRDEATPADTPAKPEPALPESETEHIEDDGEPLGANFA